VRLTCSQPNGEMSGNRLSSNSPVRFADRLDGPVQIHGVPQDNGGDNQIEAAGSVSLVFEAAVADFTESIQKDGSGQGILGFPLC
jgi:hypothetical protein